MTTHRTARARRGTGQDALLEVLAEEVWGAILRAVPADTDGDVLLAVLGECLLHGVHLVAHHRRTPQAELARRIIAGLTHATDRLAGDTP